MTELIESITLFAYILRFSDPIKAFKTGCPPASSSTPPPLPRRNFSIRGLVFLKYLSLPKKMILLHYLNWPEIFQAICILLVGIIAGCFAYFQWRTTNNKLKLDLFDKRFFIFKSVSGFIGKVVTQRRLEQGDFDLFVIEVWPSRWLFNVEIYDYLNEILMKGRELSSLQTRISDLTGDVKTKPELYDERSNLIIQETNLAIWFNHQFPILFERFSPFLQLSDK